MTRTKISGDKRAAAEGREAPRAPERERSGAAALYSSTRSGMPATPPGGALDTLAQLGQKTAPSGMSGGEKSKGGTLLKRARAKYFSMPLAINLAMLRSPLEKSYRNTAYCSATLSQENGKIIGSYCGNRWCMVCGRIRTARAIQRYLPTVESWQDKHLVTLTVRNVPKEELPATLDGMIKAFQGAKLAMRRTDRVKLVALRKLECTHNERTREFHPHFHVIVSGEAAARLLVLRWLEAYPDSADVKGQDIRPCDTATVREVFKYFTKLVAHTRMVDPKALDVIFQSMKGHRVYQPVGFTVSAALPDDDEATLIPIESTDATIRAAESVKWEWLQGAADWVDLETGLCLTGYTPDDAFRELVEGMPSSPSPST